ncbi:TetR family transcriptional regulator [Caballeronia sp. LZ032]|uniref:TetR family transcriptional regulator n=1 Tax=Caballeronia sp. LZ032 TaxID=3038565 RepID=UPI00285EADCF|nr:TetR family transcriptional regulator [Caballeronia sp. LZ032]MDR5882413.1 TetR family transcriptional regulator [Caballeronia sp. LZ032]
MKRTRQEALATREQILDAAECVFAEQGVSAATLDAVALRAGFTRGAVYGHFRNKRALLAEVMQRVTLPMDVFANAVDDGADPDPLGEIRQRLLYFLGTVVVAPRNRRLCEVLYTKSEHTNITACIFDMQRDAAVGGREQFGRHLAHAVARGQLPPGLDVKRAAGVVHAFLGGVLREWLLGRDAIALPRDAANLTDVCIGMLRLVPLLRPECASEQERCLRG